MKEIIVKNYKEMEAIEQGTNENTFSVKAIVQGEKCNANFVEVEPGNFAYGYHYHENNEEIFYIISGVAEVKIESGTITLKQGDAICFPANINGSHVISNPSQTDKLVYLDFGTANRPDVVHFTGTNSGMVIANSGIYNFKS